MQHSVNPQQTRLFDAFDPVLTDKNRQRLDAAKGRLDPAIQTANLNLLKRATFKPNMS